MPTLQPTCTCFIAGGRDPGQLPERPLPGHIDQKGRWICQVHFPVDDLEYQSRATDGMDDFIRPEK
jgi:hypothetical protein